MGVQSHPGNFDPRAMNGQKQHRARQQLSCTACRAGKLKCNRQHPCDQCCKRAKEDGCLYLPPPAKKKQSKNTKDRIAQLEGLVVQLMNRGGSDPSPPASEDGTSIRLRGAQTLEKPNGVVSKESPQSDTSLDSVSQDLTYLKINSSGQSTYRGGSHWEAILDSIADLRESVEDEDVDDAIPEDITKDEQYPSFSKVVIIGVPPPVTRDVLISSLPPKHIADRLLWHWFNSTDPALGMIHQPTFLTQYDMLWSQPHKISTMWLALLYCILSLGSKIALFTITNERRGTIHASLNPDKLQQLAASAMALADYTKPQRYVLEALMLLVSCEYMNFGRGHHIWLMLSYIIRLALRMGYHRDGDNYASISVFDAEMRRRAWNIMYTFDVLHSYQEGMPSMILDILSDTKPPQYLLDVDFGPDSKELPIPRSPSEVQPVSYRVIKNRLSKTFARACDMSNMTQAPDYDEVVKLEQQIEHIRADTPANLKFAGMSQAILDTPGMIFNRYKLELLFHKTRCVLHRRYMSQDSVGSPKERSREICVKAAMRIMEHHEAIFVAAQDGGQLSSSRFYVAAMNAADFLLGAMILCLELHLISTAPSPTLAGPNQDRVEEMRSLIEKSYNIWKQPVNHFADTEKAAKAMEAILQKIPRPSALGTSSTNTPDTSREFKFTPTSTELNDMVPIRGAFGSTSYADPTAVEPISNMLSENQDIGNMDWTAWDKMVLQFNDPNGIPTEWAAGPSEMDFISIAGLQPTDFGADNSMLEPWSNGTNWVTGTF